MGRTAQQKTLFRLRLDKPPSFTGRCGVSDNLSLPSFFTTASVKLKPEIKKQKSNKSSQTQTNRELG